MERKSGERGNKKKVCFVTEQIERAAKIYHIWQSESTDGDNYQMPELYRSVGIAEIENKAGRLLQANILNLLTMI